MARDHNKLRVFHRADALAFDIYQATKAFPADERYELTKLQQEAWLLKNGTYQKLHEQADVVVRSLSRWWGLSTRNDERSNSRNGKQKTDQLRRRKDLPRE